VSKRTSRNYATRLRGDSTHKITSAGRKKRRQLLFHVNLSWHLHALAQKPHQRLKGRTDNQTSFSVFAYNDVKTAKKRRKPMLIDFLKLFELVWD